MTKSLLPVVAMALLGVAGNAAAETAYVTDILRLGIHRAADTSDRAFDSLVSGTQLEVLESSKYYARVRTSGGQEGWVKAAYLVRDKPAQLRVTEVEAELETLREQLTAAEASRTEAEKRAAELEHAMASDESAVASLKNSLAQLQQQTTAYRSQADQSRSKLPLAWVGAALLLTLVGGFAFGWWWLDAQIRRRHGGYRVY